MPEFPTSTSSRRSREPPWRQLLWWQCRRGVTTASPAAWVKLFMPVSIWCVPGSHRWLSRADPSAPVAATSGSRRPASPTAAAPRRRWRLPLAAVRWPAAATFANQSRRHWAVYLGYASARKHTAPQQTAEFGPRRWRPAPARPTLAASRTAAARSARLGAGWVSSRNQSSTVRTAARVFAGSAL